MDILKIIKKISLILQNLSWAPIFELGTTTTKRYLPKYFSKTPNSVEGQRIGQWTNENITGYKHL